ncbi:MAG: glycosyl hydrolase, partial [Microbacterium sp.]
MRASKRVVGIAGAALAAVVAGGFAAPILSSEEPAAAASAASIDPSEFAAPGVEYRPGVRWWWPGNGATEQALIEQLEYLHEEGFGAVEIAPFSKAFWTDAETSSLNPHIHDALDGSYDDDQILGYESPEYFDKLEAVVKRANELGITVDLNIGSGYLANDDSIDVSESQSNLALGRATIRVAADGAAELVSGDVDVEAADTEMSVGIPDVEVSPFYASEKFGHDFGVWSPDDVELRAVVLAPVDGTSGELTENNQVLSSDFSSVKSYDATAALDLADAVVVYPEPGDEQFSIDPETVGEGDYEIISLYSLPTGSFGLNSILTSGDTGERNMVVDHLDPDAVSSLVHGWLGQERLQQIVTENDVRAGFNDSYEFYTDAFYNDRVQDSASSEEILGYDVTRFVPAMYNFFGESFLIDGAPTVKDEYAELGMNDFTGSFFGPSGPALIESGLTEDEAERVEYDYGRLVNEALLSGMGAFSDSLGDFGMVYRQQAYNPPVDTLKSAELVDIPETEGLDEYSLKRVASGAHLYGRNLVTSEVYTLGSTPFTVTPDFIKQGFDLMATSGVNNFFYHGLSATYFGNENPDFTSDDDLFGEEGWRAWPTIGVEMAETNPMHEYFGEMNAYASRANYLMQSGSPSGDVAMYMPLFGSLEETETVAALQSRGVQWDAINDDTIQSGLSWNGEQLVANDGAMTFDSLIVESDSVPFETMTALRDLSDAGAPIRII